MKWIWIFEKLGLVSSRQEYKQRAMLETSDVNFSNITRDWQKAKLLYDQLKKKCHPDLFSDELKDVATDLFQSLMNNKYSYEDLQKIRDEAEAKLGIKL